MPALCVQNGQQRDAEEFFRLYLGALDEELLVLLASTSGHNSATATLGVEERQMSRSGLTEVVKRDLTVRQLFDLYVPSSPVLMHGHEQESVESRLMRIFGGKFRSTLRAPNQPDTITIEDWLPLHLDIQVRFSSSRFRHTCPAGGD